VEEDTRISSNILNVTKFFVTGKGFPFTGTKNLTIIQSSIVCKSEHSDFIT